MNVHISTVARRTLAAVALTCAAALVPAAALASPGPQAGAARTATPSCATTGLDVWLDTQGTAAQDTTYYNLEFTNLSGSSCSLYGYPAVSAVTLTGIQLGSGSFPSGGTPHTVTLANGATAHAVLGITKTADFPPSQCHPVTAAGLQVHPPGQTKSRVAPFPFGACSKSGPIYLTIRPVQS
jgi:hypothetical protein